MAERDEIGRSLALAKGALGAPPAARARVRARLAAEVPGSAGSRSDQSPARAAAPPAVVAPSAARALVRAFAWVSIGLCVGYWLGFQRIGASLVEPTRVAQETPTAVPVEARPALAPDAVPGAPSSGADDAPGAARATPASTEGRTQAAGAVAERASEAASVRARVPSRATPSRRHPDAVASRTPRSESTLAAEIALLERAERAIRAGEGKLALVLVDQLEREFPASALHQERAAARVLARCIEARSAGPAERVAARSGAQQFLANGSSVYAERVRERCAVNGPN